MRTKPHPGDISAVRRVHRYIKSQGPFDIVHGHSSKGGAIARLASVGTASQSVFTPHGFVCLNPKLSLANRLFYSWCEKILGHLSGAIIGLTEQEKEKIIDVVGRGRQIFVVPNGIDSPVFMEVKAARRELGLKLDELVVGFVGRFGPQKDPLGMLERFVIAQRELPGLRLVMIGDGPLRKEVEQQVIKWDLVDNVVLPGAIQAGPLLKAFDLFAMSSMYEGMPYVLLEAMKAGLPIVSTQVSGVNELVQSAASGFVVEQGDARQFGNRMLELLSCPATRESFGREALARAERFSTCRMVGETVDVYRQALGQNGR